MNQEDFHTRMPLPSEKVRLVLLASASAQPFAEVFWETTKNDSEIAVLLINLFSHLQEEKRYDQMFEVLRILHGAFRVHFGSELLALQSDAAALACFLDCFFRDFYEIIDDHVSGIG
jgi:mannose-6-phosphate isomerase-like protein (cupin superfamily)